MYNKIKQRMSIELQISIINQRSKYDNREIDKEEIGNSSEKTYRSIPINGQTVGYIQTSNKPLTESSTKVLYRKSNNKEGTRQYIQVDETFKEEKDSRAMRKVLVLKSNDEQCSAGFRGSNNYVPSGY